MPARTRIKERYELQEIIGRGGMGVVYKAYDTVVKREVALKTIRDLPNPKALELFRKECGVMASISHPNIVEVFDIGEFEENGVLKPYLVMPLLPGTTLDHLIHDSSQPLTVDRAIDIILQTCRGLQAAHERSLIHRDLKPSNIFVMPDHAVKVIDFGLAHMANSRTSMTIKGGTLPYMAPEQLEMKPASSLSDIFSLGVIFYEILTRRRPFDSPESTTDEDIIQAILHQSPPPVTELNPAVSQFVSRVVHKAMAKQPWNRFKSARELAETLQKAQRNEPIEFFDDSRIEPRVQRALKAFEQSNYQFAGDILSELEAEGHLHPGISALRRQLDQAVQQQRISQLLDSARTCLQEDEHLLALQKLQEVLQTDKNNSTALSLKASIENRLSEQKVEQWTRLARQHLEQNAFSHAREALKNLLQVRPKEASAIQLLAEVDRREQEYVQVRQEKHQLYEAAIEAWKSGEMSAALTKMERLIELDRQAPDTSNQDRGISYQTFYNQVRSEYDASRSAYQEARKHLLDGDFSAALEICQQYLDKYPGHVLFQALKFDVEERQRQEVSSRIAEIDRRVQGEPDLDRRVNILKEALERYPGEPHFDRALRLMRDRRDLVASIAAKARTYEERAQFNEALSQWETLQTIHNQYPGLEFEIERVIKRRDQQTRTEAKARWVDQIDRLLEAGDYGRALELTRNATAEFPDDQELVTLETLASQGQARARESLRLLAEGHSLCARGRVVEGLAVLRKAHELDPHNFAVRAAYLTTLLEEARAQLDKDWTAADALISQALSIDPAHPLAKSLQTLVLDRKCEEYVSRCVAEARQMQANGEQKGALARVAEGLAAYPKEQRLLQLRSTLLKSVPDAVQSGGVPQPVEASLREPRREDRIEVEPPVKDDATVTCEIDAHTRSLDLESLRLFCSDPTMADSDSTLKRAEALGARYPDDEEFRSMVTSIRTRLTTTQTQDQPPLPPQVQPSLQPAAEPVPLSWNTRLRSLLGRVPARPSLVKLKIKWPFVAAGAAAVLLMALAALVTWPVYVHIRTQPTGSTIRIDNQERGRSDLRLKLRAGSYRIAVLHDGYLPKTIVFNARRGHPEMLDIVLDRIPVQTRLIELPQSLQLSSDLAGQVVLDEQPPVDLQEGQFGVNALPWGSHTLKIVSRKSQTQFSFQTTRDGLAELSEPLKPGDLSIIWISSSKGRARIYCNSGPVPVAVNKQPKGVLDARPLDLSELPDGTYELTLGSGVDARTFNFIVGLAPALTISVTSGQNVGSLLVLAGEKDVRVFVDGKPQRRTTNSRGELPISSLQVGRHIVAVSKDGFQEERPLDMTIEKGKQAKVEFNLRPIPTVSSLSMREFTPGAQVSLDGVSVGSISEDGSFSLPNINSGEHTIGLAARKFKPKSLKRDFKAGEVIQLGPGDLALESVLGTVSIDVLPRDATIQIRRGTGPLEQFHGQEPLEEGLYTFIASAPNHEDDSRPVNVLGGKSVSVVLRPTGKAPIAPQPQQRTDAIADWATSAGWSREGGWYVVHGGKKPSLFPKTPVNATVTFTAQRRASTLGGVFGNKPRIRWVVNYIDPSDYVLFEIDQNRFYRTEYVKGHSPKINILELRKSYSSSKGKDLTYTLQITISEEGITHSIQNGPDWEILERWGDPSRNFSIGKFGFFLQKPEETMRVSNLRFEPSP